MDVVPPFSNIKMGRLACFVLFEEVQEWCLYDVLHRRWLMDEERTSKFTDWLDNIQSCEALYMGWSLQIGCDDNLFLFHPSTGRRLQLPRDTLRMPILQDFIFRFAATPKDCSIVAIHKSGGFFVVCSRGVGVRWSRQYRFPVGQNSLAVYDAVLCNDKIYAATKSSVIAIDAASLSSSTPDVACFPLDHLHSNSSFYKNSLIESDGQLYMVQQFVLHPSEVRVFRWRFSSHDWEIATSIGNNFFMIGERYSGSLPADPDDSTRGMVYFLSPDYNGICSFDVHCRSLTTHYHGDLHFEDYNYFNWFLMEEEEEDHDMQIDEHGEYNLPKAYNNVVIRSNPRFARRGADVVTWSPKTPWLMFANGYDATFKFIDPSSNSNTVYDLHIPELLDKELCRATDDGWLVVVGENHSIFLFNPFTRTRIDIIIPADQEECMLVHSKYALSCSPSCEGCLLFSIYSYQETGIISLIRLNTNDHEESSAVQQLHYHSDPQTTWLLSDPVYYNGLFYCLDLNGRLGTYNPATNTWVVIDVHIPLDPFTPAESCFLIKSDSGDLVSVFVDRTHNPIGVFIFDSVSHHRWREVQDIGDKTLFAGPKACFVATAAKPEMENMICLSKFVGDRGNELLWHRLGVDINTSASPVIRRDRYLQLWVVPVGVRLGYDRATGKNIDPSPFICHI